MPEWQTEYEKNRNLIESYLNEFCKQTGGKLTPEGYKILYSKRLDIRMQSKQNEILDDLLLKAFDESEEGKLLKGFSNKHEETVNQTIILYFLIKSAEQFIDFKNISASIDYLQTLKFAVKNFDPAAINISDLEINILLILDALLESDKSLESFVSDYFMAIESVINPELEKFNYLFLSETNFDETFSALTDYWHSKKNLHQYTTFLAIFDVFCKVLAIKYPEYKRKCEALFNKCSDVHKYARTKYLQENTQTQQNDKPPMSTGSKEPELG